MLFHVEQGVAYTTIVPSRDHAAGRRITNVQEMNRATTSAPSGRVRLAVVGLGIGQHMLDAASRSPRAVISALCDPREELARQLADRYHVRSVYANYEEMLDSAELDAVCICTPNRLHAPMVHAAIARGLHVMCEKPLTLDTAEARSLLAAARAAGITHAVNFSNRRNPAVQFVQKQLEAGVCGSLREIHLSYLQDWMSDPDAEYTWRNSREESGSGALGDLGSHLLDLSRVFAGEVGEVFARLAIITPERPRGDGTMGTVDADDLAHLQLRYADGAYGLMRVSRVARGRCDSRCIELYGERASLVLEIDSGINRVLRADAMTGWSGDGFREVYSTPAADKNWGGNTQAWIDAIVEGRPMSPSFEDAVRCQEILDAAIRSDHERRWIDLEAVTLR